MFWHSEKAVAKLPLSRTGEKFKLWQRRAYGRFHQNKQLVADFYLTVKYTSEQDQIGSRMRFLHTHASEEVWCNCNTFNYSSCTLFLTAQFWQTQGFLLMCLFALNKPFAFISFVKCREFQMDWPVFHSSSNIFNFIYITEDSFSSLRHLWCKPSAILAFII